MPMTKPALAPPAMAPLADGRSRVGRAGWLLLLAILWAALLAGPGGAAPDRFEPNGSPAEAADTASGTTVTATLFPVGDQDFYRIPVATGTPIAVDVSLDEVASNVNPHLYLFNGRGEKLLGLSAPPGQPLLGLANLADPGSLTVQVCDGPSGAGEYGNSYEWHNQQASQPYRLTVTVRPMPDDHEPNGTRELARPLPLNGEFRGRLFPAGDQDWFRLDLPPGVRGQLTVRVGHPSDLIQPNLALHGPTGQDLDVGNHPRGVPAMVTAEVATGPVFIQFMDGGQGKGEYGNSYEFANQASRLEYEGVVRFQDVTDPREPNDTQAVAATVSVPLTAGGHLFPRGDIDWFAFELPAPGVGRVTVDVDVSHAPICPRLRLLNPRGEELTQVTGPETGLCRLAATVREPGRYLVELIDSGSGSGEYGNSYEFANRTGPYHLRIAFLPVTDPAGLHGDADHAVALTAGKTTASILFPAGDTDHYSFALTGSGPTEVTISVPDLPSPIAPHLELTDDQNRTLLTTTSPVDHVANKSRQNLKELILPALWFPKVAAASSRCDAARCRVHFRHRLPGFSVTCWPRWTNPWSHGSPCRPRPPIGSASRTAGTGSANTEIPTNTTTRSRCSPTT